MPVCQTAMTKCLPPTVFQAHVLKILVFLFHLLLCWCGVSSLANQSFCHAVHMSPNWCGSSMLCLSFRSARRRLSKMSRHASWISVDDFKTRAWSLSCLGGVLCSTCCRVKKFVKQEFNASRSASVQAPVIGFSHAASMQFRDPR